MCIPPTNTVWVTCRQNFVKLSNMLEICWANSRAHSEVGKDGEVAETLPHQKSQGGPHQDVRRIMDPEVDPGEGDQDCDGKQNRKDLGDEVPHVQSDGQVVHRMPRREGKLVRGSLQRFEMVSFVGPGAVESIFQELVQSHGKEPYHGSPPSEGQSRLRAQGPDHPRPDQGPRPSVT